MPRCLSTQVDMEPMKQRRKASDGAVETKVGEAAVAGGGHMHPQTLGWNGIALENKLACSSFFMTLWDMT